ncbi:MAG: hypothetical protein HZB56_11995 [Deltaproteobacteria bacterium]|nr:hypothetical protein [Deltaproteobacteria bacterium]
MSNRAATLLGVLALAACGGGDDALQAAPSTCPIPTAVAQPTFAGHILPRLLRQSCGAGTVTCHGGTQGTAAGHVSYDAALSDAAVHGSLVGRAPASAPAGYQLVAPGDRVHSWLLVKVEGGQGAYGFPMPQGEPPLCAATLETLRSWIDRGAPLGP